LPVAKQPSDRGNVNTEIGFIDRGRRPGAGEQRFLAHQIARVLDQGDEDVKRAAADPNRSVAFQQQLVSRKQAKRAKCDCAGFLRHSSRPLRKFTSGEIGTDGIIFGLSVESTQKSL
jgi:hypothetical protein